jgi:hypothetical protein
MPVEFAIPVPPVGAQPNPLMENAPVTWAAWAPEASSKAARGAMIRVILVMVNAPEVTDTSLCGQSGHAGFAARYRCKQERCQPRAISDMSRESGSKRTC